MSTFGTAFVVDVAPGGSPFDPPPAARAGLVGGFTTSAPGGGVRTVALVSEVDIVEALVAALALTGQGRLAVAEDNDEYGACWLVARVDGGRVETVHRRYVLNADPDDQDQVDAALIDLDRDPRLDDIGGPAAASAAAELFGAPPQVMVGAEDASASAWEEIGVVGGPFPWWEALGLPWPVPPVGEPLHW